MRESGVLKGEFLIRAAKRCGDCGYAFEPPSGKLLSGLVVLLGLSLVAAPWPTLIETLSPFDPCMAALELVFVIACFLGGLPIIYRGIHAFRGNGVRAQDLNES